ncbi:MAG: septum formation initiator family protein [Defluviitaleaceae bacterium]|nr:septum formation initiator family protein [Defluviitaleaceae bacterium]
MSGKKYEPKRAKKINKKRIGAILFLLLWVFMAVFFSAATAMQMSRYNVYRRELVRLEEELFAERMRTVELEEQIAYYDSDAYIEQLARELLGFIKEDEFIFINVAD